MYLLLFQAWAELMGFAIVAQEGASWAGLTLTETLTSWGTLANYDPSALEAGASKALMLTNLMTHTSMILIFLFVVGFIVFLFKAVSSWVRR